MSPRNILPAIVMLAALAATATLRAQTVAQPNAAVRTDSAGADRPDLSLGKTPAGVDAVPDGQQAEPAPPARDVKPAPIEPSQKIEYGTAEFRTDQILSDLVPIPQNAAA